MSHPKKPDALFLETIKSHQSIDVLDLADLHQKSSSFLRMSASENKNQKMEQQRRGDQMNEKAEKEMNMAT